jgi:hypothetical protein
LKLLNQFKIYGLDVRSIIAFRITLGIGLLLNLIYYKIYELNLLFLPSKGLYGNFFKEHFVFKSDLWSPLSYIESDILFIILMVLYAVSLIFFTCGKFMRLATLYIFIYFWAFQQRFSIVSFGYDNYFMILITCALLIPLTIRKIETITSVKFSEVRTPFVFFIIFQIACIYGFAVIGKSGDLWKEGIASYFLLSDAMIGDSIACQYLTKGYFVPIATYITLIFELLLPVLLFFPWKNKHLRLIAAFTIILFHWGISVFVNVGHFKYAGLAAAILLLPSSFWQFFLKDLKFENKPQIKYKSHKIRLAQAVIAVLFSLAVLCQNLSVLPNYSISKIAAKIKLPLFEQSSIFTQNWNLYAPNPPLNNGKIEVVLIKENIETNPYKNIKKFSLFNINLCFYKYNMNNKNGKNLMLFHKEYLLNKYPEYDDVKFYYTKYNEYCSPIEKKVVF